MEQQTPLFSGNHLGSQPDQFPSSNVVSSDQFSDKLESPNAQLDQSQSPNALSSDLFLPRQHFHGGLEIPENHRPEQPNSEFLRQLATSSWNVEQIPSPLHQQPFQGDAGLNFEPDLEELPEDSSPLHSLSSLSLRMASFVPRDRGGKDIEFELWHRRPDPHSYLGEVPNRIIRSTLPNLPIYFPPTHLDEDKGNRPSISAGRIDPNHRSDQDVTSLLKEGLVKYRENECQEATAIFTKVGKLNYEVGARWVLNAKRMVTLRQRAEEFAKQNNHVEAAKVYKQMDDERAVQLRTPWVQEWLSAEQVGGSNSAEHTFAEKIEKWEYQTFREKDVEGDMEYLENLPVGKHRNIAMGRFIQSYLGDVPLPGYLLDSGWEVGKFIGQGIAGVVVEASHSEEKAATVVACKMLRMREDYKKAIKNEVKLIQMGKTKHVVDIMGHYPWRDWWYCIFMPLADGNLTGYLNCKKGLAMDSQDAIREVIFMRRTLFTWIECLAATLEILHKRDICHGDIKPGNILIYGQTPVFADFGLAASAGEGAGSSLGSLRYAAPGAGTEGARKDAGDVFALGGVFFDMLAVISSPVLEEGSVFPTVETFAASIEEASDFFDEVAQVHESIRLNHMLGEEPCKTEGLLDLVLRHMLTFQTLRKDAASVSRMIKQVMRDKNFVNECCIAREPIERDPLADRLFEAGGPKMRRLYLEGRLGDPTA
jgi:hypothetical protein